VWTEGFSQSLECLLHRRFGDLLLGLTQEEEALLTKPASFWLWWRAHIAGFELPGGAISAEIEMPSPGKHRYLGQYLRTSLRVVNTIAWQSSSIWRLSWLSGVSHSTNEKESILPASFTGAPIIAVPTTRFSHTL
jgi:hypothetical protein